MLVKQRAHAGQCKVVAAQRRTLVTGDESGCVEPRAPVTAHLVHGQADKGLNAREVHGAAFGAELVVEFHREAGAFKNSINVSRVAAVYICRAPFLPRPQREMQELALVMTGE